VRAVGRGLSHRGLARPPWTSRDAQQLVGLEAQAPAWVGLAVGYGGPGVGGQRRAVHGLQQVVAEGEPSEAVRHGLGLRVDQLQLIPASQGQRGTGLGADAQPVDPRRGRPGAVGLYRDLEALAVQAAIRAASSWRRGSPPVQTTKGWPSATSMSSPR